MITPEKKIGFLVGVLLSVIVGAIIFIGLTWSDFFFGGSGNGDLIPRKGTLTQEEALMIARRDCVGSGNVFGSGMYDEAEKVWQFSARWQGVREECDPICIVNEQTHKAQFYGRCVNGGVPPRPNGQEGVQECGIENCHGLDIVCGSNRAEACTELYQLGDRCRQYADCSVVGGICKYIENPQFTACKNCVRGCEDRYGGDSIRLFQCEGDCE